jgi:zinc protease
MHLKLFFLLGAALLTLLNTAVHAQKLPLERQISAGVLDNGMRYFLRPTATAGADIRLVVNVGSLDERDDEQGFAHFIEHLAFRKTKQFADGSIIEFVRGLGGSFGQHLNAFTNYNQTQYWITLPNNKVSSLPMAAKILSNWAFGIEFTDELVNIERGVVIAEKRARDQSAAPAGKIRSALFDQGLYRREIIGTYDSLNNAKAEKLMQFYQRTYTPDKMSVIVTGQLTEGLSWWSRKLNDEFGQAPASPSVAAVRPAFEFSNRSRLLKLRGSTNHSLSLLSLTPQTIGSTQQDFEVWLIRNVAVSALNQRLAAMVKQRPWLNKLTAADFALTGDARAFEIGVTVDSAERLNDGFNYLREVLLAYIREGPTAEELLAAKTPLLQNARTLEEEGARLAPSIVAAAVAAYAHAGGYKLAPIQYRELVETLLPSITAAQVVKQIVDSFEKNDFLIVEQTQRDSPATALDQRKVSQTTQAFLLAMRQALASTSATSTTTLQALAINSPIEFSPRKITGAVIAEQDLGDDVFKWTLSNRATVYLKSIRTTTDQVAFSARRHIGLWQLEPSLIATGRVAMAGAWLTSGLANLDQLALQREINRKNISLRTVFGTTESGFSTLTRGEDLPFALALFHEFASRPKNNPDDLKQLLKQVKPNLMATQLSPEAQFQIEWQRARYGTNPWMNPPSAMQIDNVSPESLAALHNQVFGDASQLVFAFTGNISFRDIRRLCEQYLANLPSADQPVAATSQLKPEIRIPSEKTGVRWQAVAGKAPRATLITRHISIGPADTPENNTYIAAMQSVLNNRLRIALREDTGLTYSPRASIQFNRAPVDSFTISVNLTVAPNDVAVSRTIIESVVKSLVDQTPTEQELRAFRESYAESTRQLFVSATAAADFLINFHWRQFSLNQVLLARKSIISASAQQLQNQFSQMLVNAQVSIGILMPES